MVKTRILPLIFILVLTITMLAGCNPNASVDNSDNSEETETPQKTVLTLATFGLDRQYQEAVADYNATSSDYMIEIIEYGDLESLTLDLTTGNTPDIMHITMFLPYMDYVRSGLFTDLYPYIDSDPVLSRDSFVQAPLCASENNGSLFGVFPDFYVYTVFGNPEIVGADSGWNIAEFKDVLDAHPQADDPFGGYDTKVSFLMNTIRADIDEYIDMENGEVYFSTPQFIRLLSLSDRFPDAYSFSDENISGTEHQIAQPGNISSLSKLLLIKAELGGNIVAKGYPSDTGNNHVFRTEDNCFAILTTSTNKDASWSFLRMLLDKDWQLENVWNFPSNQEAFDEKIRREMSLYYEISSNSISTYDKSALNKMDINGEIVQITQADKDMLLDLINSATSLYYFDEILANIIRAEVTNYANGTSSAEETARFLQKRVSIYVSERS